MQGGITGARGGDPLCTFVHDSLKRLKQATNPESGTINYTYDANSNLATKLDARSITTTYAYDALNRVISRIYTNDPQSTPVVNYYYDNQSLPAAKPPSFTPAYSKGRLIAVCYGGVTSSAGSYQSYDQLGRVNVSYQQTDSINYGFSYAYNFASEMISETYPSGRQVITEYDTAGRAAGIRSALVYYAGATASDATNRIQYAAHGAVSVMQLGNGKWEHTNFNSRLQPTQIGLGTSGTDSSVLKLDYGYGTTTNNGNVLSQTITAPKASGGNLVLTQTYTYDSLNRLLSASESGSPSWVQNYDYDRWGNRAVNPSSTLIPNPALTPTSLSNFSTTTNRITLTGFGYDAAGNMTKDPTTTPSPPNGMTYDGENRQLSYTKANAVTSYVYDGDGHRVKKVTGSVTTVFVYNAMGQLTAEYTNDTTPPAGGGGTSYLTSDHLGSTRLVTRSDGTVKARYDYLPFGEEIPSNIGSRGGVTGYGGADSTKQKFTQKERDNESGLDYFLARYYSSAQGRFTSHDPLGPWAMSEDEKAAFLTTPQKWNRYSYVTNNPLRYSDPDGLEQYDRSVAKEQQERIHQALVDISINGNEHQQAVANYILATDVTIRLVQGIPDGGRTDVNSNSANNAIANGPVSETQAGGFIRISVNKSNADDSSRKGTAMLEGVLVHEGEHVTNAARTISSFSETGRVFNPTVYQDEHSAFVSEATFFRDRGGAFTKVGLKPRSHNLLMRDERGNIKINEAQIRRVLWQSYGVSPTHQGQTSTEKFGLHRSR